MNVQGLLERLKQTKTAAARLEKAIEKAQEGDSWEVIALVGILEGVEREAGLNDETRRLATELRAEAEKSARLGILELQATLQDICARRNWRRDGQWPSFTIERGIDVQIDENRRSVLIGGQAPQNLSPAAIERLLDSNIRGLVPPSFDPKSFMAGLVGAYDAARQRGGTQIVVWDLYRHMVLAAQRPALWRDAKAKRFQEFTIDQFRARLSAALEAGVTMAPDGRELRLFPPIDPKQGLFMYQPAERRFGFVGRVEYVALGKTL